MPSNDSPHDAAKPPSAHDELRAQIESTVRQARLQIADITDDPRDCDFANDDASDHNTGHLDSELDESWLADDKLQELASQLNSDANHLSNCYPSSDEALVERASSKVDYQPKLPNRRAKPSRRLIGVLGTVGLAMVVLVVLSPWLISLRDNQINPTTDQSPSIASSDSHIDQERLARSGSSSMFADQSQPRIETVLVDTESSIESSDLEQSLVDNSATSVGLNSEVTDVSYRSNLPLDISNPLIYHANQAELEGLIDVVEGTPEKKIRIGF